MIKFFYNEVGILSCQIGAQVYQHIFCKKALPLDLHHFENIGIYDSDQQEIYWLQDLKEISDCEKQLVIQALTSQFMFKKIEKIIQISSIYFPNIWEVIADGQVHSFEIENAEHLLHYAGFGILIRNVEGQFYLLPPVETLENQSQKKLQAFL